FFIFVSFTKEKRNWSPKPTILAENSPFSSPLRTANSLADNELLMNSRAESPGEIMPASLPQQQVTQLLSDWRSGDRTALEKLIPLVQPELQRLAHRYMSRERPGHTLQTTALLDDAYLELSDKTHPQWQNRAHFFAVAAQLMRRIMVNHARQRQ